MRKKKGLCRKCLINVNGKNVLSCKYEIHSNIKVTLPAVDEILSESGIEEIGEITENMCIALDIGTTTLCMALVSLDEQKVIQLKTSNNPQRIFGADVISRIEFCSKKSVFELQSVLITEINRMIAEFNLPAIDKMYVSGNTVMLHTFFGVDCSSMGKTPYTPSFLASKKTCAKQLVIRGVNEIISLPCISAFIGADTVAGLNFIEKPKNKKYNLLIDLGTNAEIVLFSENQIFCTSAAAGPCFEGANISCGMTATNGAIYKYNSQNIKTIGDIKAKGICGTGLIYIISFLLEQGLVDKTGYMACDKYNITESVFINQADIRQY